MSQVHRQIAQQLRFLADLLDAADGLIDAADGLIVAEPAATQCLKCEGPLREVVIDGKPGLICGECNTPAEVGNVRPGPGL